MSHGETLSSRLQSAARAGGWLILLCCLVIRADPARAAQPETVLVAGAQRVDHLTRGQDRRYRIELMRGQAIELTFEQRDVALQLRWTTGAGAVSPIFGNDAGRAARLRLTLIADAATIWHLDVSAAADQASASYEVVLGQAHSANAVDHARAAAVQALADAENLRRKIASQGHPNDAGSRNATNALAAYTQAIQLARAAEDDCLLLMAHADLARLQYASASYTQAAQSAHAALQHRCGDDADPSAAAERAVAERTLGSALGYTGDLVGGTAAQERALALYRQTGDPHFQAMALGNLSADYRVLGETHKALDAAQRALRLAESHGDSARALFVGESVAAIHLQRGELALARDGYMKTIEHLKATPDPMLEGMAWNDLGLLYRQLGDDRQSTQAYRNAETAWKSSGDLDGLTETRINEAETALERHDVESATGLFNAALAYYASHHRQREQAHALGGLGRCALARGAYSEARRQLLASRDAAHAAGAVTLEVAAYLALGDLDLRELEVTQATRDYSGADELARVAHDPADRAAALAGEAHAAQQAGQLSDAKGLIERALDIIEDQRTQITDPMLATEYFSTQRAYYDRAIDILMQLDRQHPGHGNAIAALEMSERARARSLQELLAQRTIRIEKDLDPSLLDAEQAAEDKLRTNAYQLTQLRANATAGERVSLHEKIDQASIEVDEARGRIRAASPKYAEIAHPTALKFDAIKQLLDDNVVVLDYWLGTPHSYLWTVSRIGVRASVLPSRDRIDALARELRTKLESPQTGQMALSIEQLAARDRADLDATRKLAGALDRIVLSPAIAASDARTIVVIADGALRELPFVVLDPVLRTSHASAAGHDFVYLPSIDTLRALRKLPRSIAPRRRLAVFADPVFRANDPRLDARNLAGTAPAASSTRDATEAEIAALPALPYSRDEAREIAALDAPHPVREVLDFDATRTAVIDTDWSPYSIVHFATHALLNGRHPELSGIVLSLYDSGGKPIDGFLRMNDIYNLRMPADLVVLSICDSALGNTSGPDGMFTLSRAFFYAGARRVIASLWPVDDRASAAFMAYFYRVLLKQHRSPQAALTAAQDQMRTQPRWNRSFYWAGFVLQGDWK